MEICFSDRARVAMERAGCVAQQMGCEEVTPPLIMLGLLDDKKCVARRALVRSMEYSAEYFQHRIRALARPKHESSSVSGPLRNAPSIAPVIKRAQQEARMMSSKYIATEHMLLALLKSVDPVLSTVFRQFRVQFEAVQDAVEQERAIGEVSFCAKGKG